MPEKSLVAVLFTTPETVLKDYQRLFELAGGAQALQPGVPTILKDNITWHFPMPGANTTPWQLEGAIQALRASPLEDLGLAVLRPSFDGPTQRTEHLAQRLVRTLCPKCKKAGGMRVEDEEAWNALVSGYGDWVKPTPVAFLASTPI